MHRQLGHQNNKEAVAGQEEVENARKVTKNPLTTSRCFPSKVTKEQDNQVERNPESPQTDPRIYN